MTHLGPWHYQRLQASYFVECLSLVWYFLVITFILCILAGLPQTWRWFLLIVSYQVVRDFNLSHFMDAVHFDCLIKVRCALLTLHGLWLSMLELAVSKQLPLFPLLRLWYPVQAAPLLKGSLLLLWLRSPTPGCSLPPSWMPSSSQLGSATAPPPADPIWALTPVPQAAMHGDTSAQSGLWHSEPTQLPCPPPPDAYMCSTLRYGLRTESLWKERRRAAV